MASNNVYNVYKRNGSTCNNINNWEIKSEANTIGKNVAKKAKVDTNLSGICQTEQEINVIKDMVLLSHDELPNSNVESKYYTRRNLEHNAKSKTRTSNLKTIQSNDNNANGQNANFNFGNLETTKVDFNDNNLNLVNNIVDVVVQNLLDVAITRNISNVEYKCSSINERKSQPKNVIECNHSNVENGIPTIKTNVCIHANIKSELEKEMELYEAFERNQDAHLINHNLHNLVKEESTMEIESQNKKKRTSEGFFYERRNKRNKCEQRVTTKAKNEEDVCFICFDGGDLVLCDHRLCPKVYHLNCIGREKAFFLKKGTWLCGYHFCLNCKKSGKYQCYTCPTSFCKQCIKGSDFCIQSKRKGLCEECLPIVSMIEHNKTTNHEGEQVDFEDKETYEFLFKEYWLELKKKNSILISLLDNGRIEIRNTIDYHSPIQNHSNGEGSDNDYDKAFYSLNENFEHPAKLEGNQNHNVEIKQALESNVDEKTPPFKIICKNIENDKIHQLSGNDLNQEKTTFCKEAPSTIEGWASKELKAFLENMKEDTSKPLTKFVVHKLLWMYVKQHKLQNPRKMSDIICDKQLRLIFEKESIGQFEMFKLLNKHFPPKESPNLSKKVMITIEKQKLEEFSPLNPIYQEKGKPSALRNKRKSRKHDESSQRPKSDEYAAINYKNISLIYLRRAILEEFIVDPNFESKVTGTFVKIRVPGNSKMDSCYRLVFVTGIDFQKESYLVGSSMTNVTLSILNLQKKENIKIDVVSNQDFTKEECERLRLNIKCGFLKTFTVGQLEEKATSLQEAKVNDWMENERQRLINLRDRASEKGRKKELRECVEKLQELNNPTFRVKKVNARPQIFVDPHMDPNYESHDGSDQGEENNLLEKDCNSTKSQNQTVNSCSTKLNWGGSCIEDNKSMFSNTKVPSSSRNEEINKRSKDWRHIEVTSYKNTLKPSFAINCSAQNKEAKPHWSDEKEKQLCYEKHDINTDAQTRIIDGQDLGDKNDQGNIKYLSMKKDVVCASKYSRHYKSMPISLVSTIPVSLNNLILHEKLWHYVDPSGTIQGPFSIEQLRKWNGTGLFPIDLRIWKTNEEQHQSILLTDGLQGKFDTTYDHLFREVEGENKKCQTSVSATTLDLRYNERLITQESGCVMANVPRLENITPVVLMQSMHEVHVANHLGALSFDNRLEDNENLQNIFMEVNKNEGYRNEGLALKGQVDSKNPCKFHMQGYCWKGKSCGYWHK